MRYLYSLSVHLERKPIVLDSSEAPICKEDLVSCYWLLDEDTLLVVAFYPQPMVCSFSCCRHSFHYFASFSAWQANFSAEDVTGPAN